MKVLLDPLYYKIEIKIVKIFSLLSSWKSKVEQLTYIIDDNSLPLSYHMLIFT